MAGSNNTMPNPSRYHLLAGLKASQTQGTPHPTQLLFARRGFFDSRMSVTVPVHLTGLIRRLVGPSPSPPNLESLQNIHFYVLWLDEMMKFPTAFSTRTLTGTNPYTQNLTNNINNLRNIQHAWRI